MNIPLIGSLLIHSLVVLPILYFKLGPALNTLQIETLKTIGIISGCSAFCSAFTALHIRVHVIRSISCGSLVLQSAILFIAAFAALVDRGHSIVVVEHNLDVIRAADWVIDLGPDAGAEGGQVVFAGTPENLAGADTFTGHALRNAMEETMKE